MMNLEVAVLTTAMSSVGWDRWIRFWRKRRLHFLLFDLFILAFFTKGVIISLR